MTLLGSLSLIGGATAVLTGAIGILLLLGYHRAPHSQALLRMAGLTLTASLFLFAMCGVRLIAVGMWRPGLALLVMVAVTATALFAGKPKVQRSDTRPTPGDTRTPAAPDKEDAEPVQDDIAVRLKL